MTDPLKKIEALANAGEYAEADRVAKTSNLKPGVLAAVLGTLALKQGDQQTAEVYLLRSLEIDPNNSVAKGNYAALLVAQKKFKKALPLVEAACKGLPKNDGFAMTYAACLADSDRFSDATEVIRPFTLAEKPKLSILVTFASLLRADLKAEAALEVLDRVQGLYPDDPEAERALGDAYAELDPRLAQEVFLKVSKRMPDSLNVQWNSSFVELRLGNFKKGWKLYEAGLTDKIGKIGRPLPAQVKGLPMITDLDALDPDKWTLLSAEQGLGDQVLFYGCVEEALKKMPKVALIGEDRMVALLQRSFPQLGVYTYGFAAGLTRQGNRINGVFPIGSLMKYYRNTEQSFSKHRRSYIVNDGQQTTKYRDTLLAKLPGKRLIGISWRGGYWDRQKRTKSFEFELFGRLMSRPDCHFIALQYGDVKEERELARKNGWPVSFIEGIDFKKEIDNWVALACACDSIISVSTALVHFAGAAGKRVDLLIGDHQAPFIWGLKEGASLPYAGINIIRKVKEETPEQFFDRVGGVAL